MPHRYGAEITNCGSFLFTTDFKKFYRKIMMVKEVFEIVQILILLSQKKKSNFFQGIL